MAEVTICNLKSYISLNPDFSFHSYMGICFLGYFFIFFVSLFILSCPTLIVFHIKDVKELSEVILFFELIAHFQRYCLFEFPFDVFFLWSVVLLLFSLLNFVGVSRVSGHQEIWCWLALSLLSVWMSAQFLFWTHSWGVGWYTEVLSYHPISRKYSA